MTRKYLDRRAEDLAMLEAGQETGWWDEHGVPAPWPEDFWMIDGTINPDWGHGDGTYTPYEPGEPPF